jgi:hypothetical protein
MNTTIFLYILYLSLILNEASIYAQNQIKSPQALSITSTLEELNQEKNRIKQELETQKHQVQQFHQTLLNKATSDTTEFIKHIDTNFTTKAKEINEKIKNTTAQGPLLTTLVDFLQLAKNIASQYNTQAKTIIDKWYTPLTKTILITDNKIRTELGEQIGQTVLTFEELKKALPKPAKRKAMERPIDTTPATPITTKDITTSPGIQGLYEFIITPPPAPVEDKTEEKLAVLNEIRSYQRKIDDIHSTFNEATKNLVQRIAKVQRIELETLEPIKKSYEILADPEFPKAPNLVKFDSLVKALEGLIEIVIMQDSKLITLITIFADFIKATYDDEANQELSDFLNHITQLKKATKTLREHLEEGLRDTSTSRKIFNNPPTNE